MGTTGTIMGTSKFLKEKNKSIEIIGLQPTDGSSIPGIRKWPKEYLPKIFDSSRVDRIVEVDQPSAEVMMRKMAEQEGIFAGVSSGAAVHAAVQLAQDPSVKNAVIVSIVCDRGDRYLSTGVYKSDHLSKIPAKPENLFDALRTVEGLKDTYVVYYSDWCPDCLAVPAIVRALDEEATRLGRVFTVVMCNVGERDLWKSGSHPLKTGAPGLKGIPTLMKWGSGRSEESRLERGLYDGSALAAGGEDGVKEVVEAFVGSS
jgi:thiol-disulfide isomerase/thioredoxin